MAPSQGTCCEHRCMCRGLEQEKQDLGRQVQTLLLQLQGGQGAERVLRLTQGRETGLVTSDDVITDRLLSFTDVQVQAGQWAGAWQCGAQIDMSQGEVSGRFTPGETV